MGLSSLKSYLGKHEGYAMKLLTSLSEEKFASVYKKTFVIGMAAEEKEEDSRLEEVMRECGAVGVLPMRVLMELL